MDWMEPSNIIYMISYALYTHTHEHEGNAVNFFGEMTHYYVINFESNFIHLIILTVWPENIFVDDKTFWLDSVREYECVTVPKSQDKQKLSLLSDYLLENFSSLLNIHCIDLLIIFITHIHWNPFSTCIFVCMYVATASMARHSICGNHSRNIN